MKHIKKTEAHIDRNVMNITINDEDSSLNTQSNKNYPD